MKIEARTNTNIITKEPKDDVISLSSFAKPRMKIEKPKQTNKNANQTNGF